MKPSFHTTSFIGFVGALLGAPQRKSTLALVFAAMFLSFVAIGVAAGYSVAPSVVVALAIMYVAQMLYLTALFYVSAAPESGRNSKAAQAFETRAPRPVAHGLSVTSLLPQ